MSKAFKKKKQEQLIDDRNNKFNFLLGSQLLQSNRETSIKLERSLILKSAMFWDSKSRVERIKSLLLSNLGLQQFEDLDDFKIEELSSILMLSLSKNKIVHLQPISVLDTLVTLNINHNKVYNLTPIQTLVNLQQLYASNNEISNIDSLKEVKNLRILNIYKNKVVNVESTFRTLNTLKKLQDLDVEENPFYCEQIRKDLVTLPITRLNDQMISYSQKGSNIQTSSSMAMTASCVINPMSLSVMRQTKNSFSNPSVRSLKQSKVRDLKNKLEVMQEEYMKLDDQFQEEIVKNVQLKTEFHLLSQQIKKTEEQKQENQYKTQQIKLLKRKAKDLKENLFTKDKKGELLRTLFELQTKVITKKIDKKQNKGSAVWQRRFDCDDVIVIEDDKKYLQQDNELAELLQSNSNALEELRKELRSLY